MWCTRALEKLRFRSSKTVEYARRGVEQLLQPDKSYGLQVNQMLSITLYFLAVLCYNEKRYQ